MGKKICTCMCHREGMSIMHMMPCCEYTYEKYIDANGILDMDKYNEITKPKFPTFWYESNACCGGVENMNTLQEMCETQISRLGALESKEEFLDRSMQHFDGSNNFGTRGEHTGDKSLRIFLTENGVDLTQL